MSTEKTFITVQATINATPEKVWKAWVSPEDIMQWCSASPDWHVPDASNDLKVGGKFSTTMAAKDGSMSFDFGGEYTSVDLHKKIAYTMGDGRTVVITFVTEGNGVIITETFEAENQNPVEMQKGGWQAILDNFKKHTEAQ